MGLARGYATRSPGPSPHRCLLSGSPPVHPDRRGQWPPEPILIPKLRIEVADFPNTTLI